MSKNKSQSSEQKQQAGLKNKSASKAPESPGFDKKLNSPNRPSV